MSKVQLKDKLVGYAYELGDKDPACYVLPCPDWVSEVWRRVFCSECQSLVRARFPEPVEARVLQLPSTDPVDAIFGPACGIIRDDVCALLGPYLDGFVFGPIDWCDGSQVERYQTFYSREYVIYRAGPGTEYAPCRECGTLLRVANTVSGKLYLLESDLAGRDLVHTDGCTTIISSRVAALIADAAKLLGIHMHPVPLLSEPIDGAKLPPAPYTP